MMASMPKIEVKLMIRKTIRLFYARPCDEPAEGWCVAEVEVSPKGARWRSSLYENVLTRVLADSEDPSTKLVRMTKAEAKDEAWLWNEKEREREHKRKVHSKKLSKR